MRRRELLKAAAAAVVLGVGYSLTLKVVISRAKQHEPSRLLGLASPR
jgi:hypothetical protein